VNFTAPLRAAVDERDGCKLRHTVCNSIRVTCSINPRDFYQFAARNSADKLSFNWQYRK